MSARITQFDWSVLDALVQRGATKKDAAGVMDCSCDTIERRIKEKFETTFTEYRELRMAGTRLKLIEVALTKAEQGDNTMLIFCLKNLCGWRDRQPDEADRVIVNQLNTQSDEDLDARVKELIAMRDVADA